jgi:hypothetical protein
VDTNIKAKIFLNKFNSIHFVVIILYLKQGQLTEQTSGEPLWMKT